MTTARRGAAWVLPLFALLFVVRHDLWWWGTEDRVFGMPIGLTYHLAFCLLVSATMAFVVRFAWPRLEDAND